MGFSTSTPAVLTYLPATNLYVNSGSGNDSGDGTISDPLQSLEEALKNVYARRVNGIMLMFMMLSHIIGPGNILLLWGNSTSGDGMGHRLRRPPPHHQLFTQDQLYFILTTLLLIWTIGVVV